MAEIQSALLPYRGDGFDELRDKPPKRGSPERPIRAQQRQLRANIHSCHLRSCKPAPRTSAHASCIVLIVDQKFFEGENVLCVCLRRYRAQAAHT